MRARWLIVVAIALAACNSERRRLTTRLNALEMQRAGVTRRIDERRTSVADAEDRLAAIQAELTAHNTEVHTFLDNHKVASACIRAARTQWTNDRNSPAHAASAASRIGAALCGVALLTAEFAQEVDLVSTKLAEADTHVNELNERIAGIRKTVKFERARIDRDREELDQLAVEMANIRAQLVE